MITITDLQASLPVFKALGSEIRMKICSIIQHQNGITLSELNKQMGMPANTLSSHLHILEDCGLISSEKESSDSKHSSRHYYFTGADQLCIVLRQPDEPPTTYHASIPVGSFCTFDVQPTCGLASASSFIGQLDEPKYFVHPLRYQAQVLWFAKGYLEYYLPNFIPNNCEIDRLSLSFEISSECPRTNNDCPSDLRFSLNGHSLGTWTSPGDYGDRRGYLNPSWWISCINQYGLLKTLTIDHTGTYMDEEKLSDLTTDQLQLTGRSILLFRIEIEKGEHENGCTLFGSSFGDHPQDIRLTIDYHYKK